MTMGRHSVCRCHGLLRCYLTNSQTLDLHQINYLSEAILFNVCVHPCSISVAPGRLESQCVFLERTASRQENPGRGASRTGVGVENAQQLEFLKSPRLRYVPRLSMQQDGAGRRFCKAFARSTVEGLIDLLAWWKALPGVDWENSMKATTVWSVAGSLHVVTL